MEYKIEIVFTTEMPTIAADMYEAVMDAFETVCHTNPPRSCKLQLGTIRPEPDDRKGSDERRTR